MNAWLRSAAKVLGPVLPVVLLSTILWWQLDAVYRQNVLESTKVELRGRLAGLTTSLAAAAGQRQALLTGLSAFVELHARDDRIGDNFELYAASLEANDPTIRSIQIMPRNGPSFVYPREGNEAVIGRTLEMLLNDERPAVRADVQRTIRSREITLSNPYELRQGGMGLVARRAVFRNDKLRAMVVVILDVEDLLVVPGLSPPPAGLRIALRDSAGNVFHGDEEVFSEDPVRSEVPLPEGSWALAAVPEAGWLTIVNQRTAFFRVSGVLLTMFLAAGAYLIASRHSSLSRTIRVQERRLVENAKRLRIAAEAARIGFSEYDLPEGRIRFSPEWKNRIGYEDDVLPETVAEWLERVHPDDREAAFAGFEAADHGDGAEHESVYRLRQRDGSYRWILSRTLLQFDDAGTPVRALGCHIDVTRQKRDEEAIRTLLTEKEILLREVHHRIKNNMSTMSSLLSLQASAMSDAAAVSALREAEGRMRSMQLLYDRLYRADNVREIPIRDYLPLLTREIIGVFPNRDSVTVETDFDDLVLDPNTLSSLGILLNELLTNVMKHAFAGREGGTLRITLRSGKMAALLLVEDDGVGPGEEMLRGEAPGFGLELVRMLAAQLGGEARFEPRGGIPGGTRVSVRFALREPTVQEGLHGQR